MDEIKENITVLNKLVRELKAVQKGTRKNLYLVSGATAAGVTATAIIFPPALIAAAALSGAAMGQAGASSALTSQVLDAAQKLRRQFKTVYRARPGRRQFNLAARRTREMERASRAARHRYYFGF